MTEISSAELDARMGVSINPNSVPTFDGTGEGHMRAHIPAGPQMLYGANELPGNDQFGSVTVISVNDAPPLPAGRDPSLKSVPVQVNKPAPPIKHAPPPPAAAAPPPAPVVPPRPPAPPAPTKLAFPALASAKPAPQAAKPVVMDPNGPTAQLMASLGLLKPKK